MVVSEYGIISLIIDSQEKKQTNKNSKELRKIIGNILERNSSPMLLFLQKCLTSSSTTVLFFFFFYYTCLEEMKHIV